MKGYIFWQGNEPYGTMASGDYTVHYNGCGAVSAYNLLVSKGVSASFPKIIKELEAIKGLTFPYWYGKRGVLGYRTSAMRRLLKNYGLNPDIRYLPIALIETIDDQIRKKKEAIVHYGFYQKIKGKFSFRNFGGHFITVRHDSERNRFLIYGTAGSTGRAVEVESVTEYLKRGQAYLVFSVITAEKGEDTDKHTHDNHD